MKIGRRHSPPSDRPYDFIVVGAGSSGCVLARRLAEAGHTTLLLEAGGAPRNPMLHIPLGFAFLLKPHRNNWSYRTQPEAGLDQRSVDLPRGKVLGGCSAINGMVYVRGQAEDYDRWAALGNKGWSYHDVLPYFTRSEDCQTGASAYHGTGGELYVGDLMHSNTPADFPVCDAFMTAAQQAGHPRNDDINAATQSGVGYFPHNIKAGRRCSSATAFLRKQPGALTVITGAEVKRVSLLNKRATGVECTVRGENRVFIAHREIVLCGGAINSPKLLELSGIGQRNRLENIGIPVEHVLPGVGENLHDHWNSYIKVTVKSEKTYFSEAKPRRMMANVWRYFLRKDGFLANPAALVAVFFKSRPGEPRADAQIHFSPAASNVDAKGNMTPVDGVTLSSCGIRPTSRGATHVVSRTVEDPPAIKVNYLETEHDRAVAIASFRRAREILAQAAWQRLDVDELAPGLGVLGDTEILSYIRRTGEPVHHLVGSCKMGHDAMAVVDDQLRVHGVAGLRVADASIMPEIVSGNTHAACVMIGEKAADFILHGAG